MKGNTNIFALTKQDTAVLKGIAIVAMLMHHLWGCAPSWVEPYTGVLGFLGSVGKVCVAIFLFCSGYGLSVGYSKVMEDCRLQGGDWKNGIKATLKFLAKRFVKFYANYWFIFLIFVPISVFCFDRPLTAAYGAGVNIPKRLLYDILGIQGMQSYNITWWFNKLILIFYALFPLLYIGVRKYKWIVLSIAFGLLFMDSFWWDYGYMPFIAEYMFPFTLGIMLCQYRDKLQTISYGLMQHPIGGIIAAVLFTCICTCIRSYDIIPYFSGIRVDALLTISLLVLILVVQHNMPYCCHFFRFAGIHSGNVYLLHTFLISYWPTMYWLYSERMMGGG